MEPMLETIDLDMEESNELLFKVKVEGAEQAPAKVRLVCESGDVGYTFNGRSAGNDTVQFNLPVMKDKLKEGVYLTRVEVLIENRYFAPVQFQINFKKAVKVVAEHVTVQPRKVAPEIKVSAIPIVKPKPAPVAPPPTPAPVAKVVEREAPPPARQSAQMTLKERYHSKKDELLTERGELNEEAILEAAKLFVRERRKK